MIHWLNPAALAGLVLLALPIVIHLLRTHHAERIPFPSLRFVMTARTAAVRLRLPADWLLLLVRLGIVAAAAAAAAAPVIVTASRLRAWNDRIVRAVIVDTSPAMFVADASGQKPIDAAREAAAAEAGSAMQVERIESRGVGDGLISAAAWLERTPPARREIVVISAFIDGDLGEPDVKAVPAGAGLRLVRVGAQVDGRHLPAAQLLAVPGGPAPALETELKGSQTLVKMTRGPARQSGLRVLGADSAGVDRVWRAVAAAGAPAPSPDEPLVCQFGPGEIAVTPVPLSPATPRWILRTLIRLQRDEQLQRVANTEAGSPLQPSDLWTVVAADRDARPLVRVSAANGQLVMQVGAPAGSFVAAVALRALLQARVGDWARPDQEILRTPPETLSAWSRPAAPVDGDAWRRSDGSDTRWFWLGALILLGVEQRLRRSDSRQLVEVRDAA
jgi:hypothetical protein